LRSLSLPLGALLAHSTARVKLESEVEERSRKLADRKLLDRAKGLLQASYQWTEEQAYLHIRLTSRQRRTPMRDIAQEIIGLAGNGPGSAARRCATSRRRSSGWPGMDPAAPPEVSNDAPDLTAGGARGPAGEAARRAFDAAAHQMAAISRARRI